MNSTEIAGIFQESPNKQNIFKKAEPRISNSFEKSTAYTPDKRAYFIFGLVFEDLAVTENLEKHHETDKQKSVRVLIEELFQKADLALDIPFPSRPDFVSVVFDKAGNLTIDEVVEIKTSQDAVDKGFSRGQPEKTLKTVENIIRIVNLMIRAKSFSEFLISSGNAQEIDTERAKFLNSVFDRIKELDLNQNISFSSNFIYHIIIPKNEVVSPQNGVKSRNKGIVPVFITNCSFSKKDVHKIIDHYAETP